MARPGQSRCAPCCAAVRRRRNAEAPRARAVVASATRCTVCGKPPTPDDPLTAGHVVPLSRGGAGGPLQPEHRSCNSRKRDR